MIASQRLKNRKVSRPKNLSFTHDALFLQNFRFMKHYQSRKKALILLADGTVFEGKSIGIEGTTSGEICFNTGMTGYQEIFTDPSYFGQLMVATNAHIGNYGVNNDEV